MDAAKLEKRCNIGKTIIASLIDSLENRGYSVAKKSSGYILFYNKGNVPLIVATPLDWPMLIVGGSIDVVSKKYKGLGPRGFVEILPDHGKVHLLSPDLLCVEGEGLAFRSDDGKYLIHAEKGKIGRWMLADFIIPAGGQAPSPILLEIALNAAPSHILAFRLFTIGGFKNYLRTLGLGGLPGILLLPCIEGYYKCERPAIPVLTVEFSLEKGLSWKPLPASVEKAQRTLESLKAKS